MSRGESEPAERIPIAAPDVGEEERERVLEVMDGGRLADGPVVREFEEEFAAHCDARRCVATANGTAALHAALWALDIGPGDTVVTTPFSFIATANAIRLRGAEPVFADIDPETYNLDPDAVESVVRDRDGDVDAVLVVHLYGLPADMDRFVELADAHDLALVEDAAQAHGATYDGRHVGAIGDVGCFSFYPTKNMTTGEGGAIVTDREDVAERAARFVNHGRTEEYGHAHVGHNFRMTSIAGAIGRAQLEKLPDYVDARRENARRYGELLSDVGVVTPIEPPDRSHAYHQYTIRCSFPDRLRSELADEGIDAGIYYPETIPEQPAYEGFSLETPHARRASDHVLSLPVHPDVTDAELRRVANETARCIRDQYDRLRL